jgi:serine/threonine-protein kinase HipA
MKTLTVRFQRRPDDITTVGTLIEKDHRSYFVYDQDFIRSGVELSPLRLRLQPGLIEHSNHAYGPLPGLFDDSLPDGWGLLLMDRRFGQQAIHPRSVSAMDRLAYLGTHTMGALTYHPATSDGLVRNDRLLDLYVLGRNAQHVFDDRTMEALTALMRAGTPPGGARPKMLIGIKGDDIICGEADLPAGFEHWMVKFSSKEHRRDAGPIEYAYSLMAKTAEIDMPPTRLFELKFGSSIQRHFAVKRFDREEGNRRLHVQTFASLIHTNFRIPSTDYQDLFKVTRALTQDMHQLLRLFKLMLFNIATHNRDDHAKNFAYLFDDRADSSGAWSLAPAYDLTFSTGPAGEHSTTIAGQGKDPSREDFFTLARQFGITDRQAKAAIEKVNQATAQWLGFADQACCSKKAAINIQKHLRTL